MGQTPSVEPVTIVFANQMPHTMTIDANIRASTNLMVWNATKNLTSGQTLTAGSPRLDYGDYTFLANAHGVQCKVGPVHVDAKVDGWQVTVDPTGKMSCPVAQK